MAAEVVLRAIEGQVGEERTSITTSYWGVWIVVEDTNDTSIGVYEFGIFGWAMGKGIANLA